MYRDHAENIESLNIMELPINTNTNYPLQNKNRKTVSFKGPFPFYTTSGFMNLAQNNAAFSTGVVDIFGMVAPRTAIDSNRNEHAGVETFRREIMGTIVNNVSPGFLALGIAALMHPVMKVNAKIWANSETADLLKEAWSSTENNELKTENYVKNVFSRIKGLEGSEWKSYTEEKWKSLPEKIKNEYGNPVEEMVKLINNKNLSKTDYNRSIEKVQNAIGTTVKSRKNINVSWNDTTKKPLETSIEHLIRDMRDVGEHIFIKSKTPEAIDTAISKLKKVNFTKSFGALAVLCTVDFVTQYVNRKMTSKKTGKKGFVGYKDFENGDCELKDSNKKRNLNIAKAVGVAALIGLNAVFIGRKNLVRKLEFKNAYANLNQIRLLFSSAVAGRIVASDDGNELRETCTRDFFSYFNWLVLGDFVTKGAIWFSDKDRSLINFNKISKDDLEKIKNPFKKFWRWSQDISIKTHSEVLDLERSGTINSTEKAAKLKVLNKSIGAGLVYSTIVLGIGIPVLNILLTNKKRNQELAAQKLNITPIAVKNKLTNKNNVNDQLFSAFIK